jgi:hypothetical protein
MLYWTPVFGESFYAPMTTGLAMIDPATGHGYNLGMIDAAGSQVSGLYVICDEFPAEPEADLLGMVMSPVKADLVVGQTAELNAITIPMNIGAEITWSSSDIDVATVDENGVVTAVAQGTATITATATLNGVKKTAECRVAILAEDAAFLTYNTTDGGWAEVSRGDAQIVTNLTEGENVAVASFANVKGQIYGYDVENTLFKLDMATYQREAIGQIDATALIEEMLISYEYTEEEIAELLPVMAFEVRDMDYDSANDRVLIVGNIYHTIGGELNSGNGIYEVDLTDGSIECLYTFHNHYYVMAMTVDNEGVVYFYNAYDDNYATLDLETGIYKNIISLQSQSYYGSSDYDHAIYFDEITGKLYHMFTGNGNYYRLFSVDLTTGAITLESNYVGEVIYDRYVYGYMGDRFAGMTFINEDANGGMPDLPIEYDVEWVSGSTTLDGTVNLNLYAKLSANVVNDPTAFVRMICAGRTVDIPVSEAVQSEVDGVVRYRFSIQLVAKQMADTVTAQVMNENGPIGEAKAYSIMQYCLNKIEDNDSAEMVALAKAMLNYGAAAQILFNYNVENLANASLSDADKALADVDASAYKYSITGSEAGIKAKSATLVMESKVAIRVYFTLEEGASIEDYTFTINGVAVAPKQNDKGYYIESEGIAAKEMDDMYEFTVGGLTVTYGALSYVNSKLNATDAEHVNLAKALYAYYAAAEAYFG